MPVVQLGALVALALAAAGPDRLASANEVAAANRPPAEAMMGSIPPAGSVVMGALPTPPKKVVLQTKTFGTITVDHAAHLARRTACRSCHGDGPVSKISFTPRQAHETCRACHLDLKAGPTDCRGCHVKPPEPPATVALAAPDGARSASAASAASSGGPGGSGAASAEAAATGRVAAPATGGPSPASPAAGIALAANDRTVGAPVGGDLPAPPPPPPVGDWEEEPGLDSELFRQSVEAGMVVRGGTHQSALFGPSIELTSRIGRALLVHHVETTGGLRSGRTLLMVGGGAAIPVRTRLALLVVGSGGLDAYGTEARLLPAVGLRVGLQWRRAVPHVELLGVTAGAVYDLLHQHDTRDGTIGDLTFSLGLTAGFGFGRNR